MPVNFEQYEQIIVAASEAARGAQTIEEALQMQAQGFRQALETAVSQMVVDTAVTTTGSPDAHTGTGLGTVS